MLFNSLNFAFFLPLVFLLYWFAANRNFRIQNILLLIASYFFYACWDFRFLFLLIFSTLLDYYTGLRMSDARDQQARKKWFWLSVCINLGFLGVFKYYNFFAQSFARSLSFAGIEVHPFTLHVILPVGISFYTFHGLSYVIDIYKGKIKAHRNLVDYSLFVSFFPLLVAGPIERATHLLPQLTRKRDFNYTMMTDGMRQILWGLFKKIVIADQCAEYTDLIFNSAGQSGSTHLLGAVLFAFQIYCDFSGYSDIALGTARLFGIDLLRNFAFPYFSRDIAEFWRRWHISLSSWFKDYLYIPLGGSEGGTWKKVRNTFIIFLVSGFWHGANWTFIVWGALNAIYFLPLLLIGNNRTNMEIVAKGRLFPTLREGLGMIITFSLTVLAWIFFRAKDLHHAVEYLQHLFSRSLFSLPSVRPAALFIFVLFFLVVEWLGREQQYALSAFGLKWPPAVRWTFYNLLMVAIFYFAGSEKQFIYFQF